MTEYGVRLREKQKVKQHYGVLERQFRNCFAEADRMRGNTGENLLMLLESRLDNVVLRAGFAQGPGQARQVVRHGHITVNGRRVDIPSRRVRQGDVVGVHPRSKSQKLIKENSGSRTPSPPEWLTVDLENLTARIVGPPTRPSVEELEINEQLIVEFCSR